NTNLPLLIHCARDDGHGPPKPGNDTAAPSTNRTTPLFVKPPPTDTAPDTVTVANGPTVTFERVSVPPCSVVTVSKSEPVVVVRFATIRGLNERSWLTVVVGTPIPVNPGCSPGG